MIRTIREPLGSLELCERGADERVRGELSIEPLLSQCLRRFTCGPARDRELRALLDARACFATAHRLGEDEVIAAVARLVLRGELTLRRRELPPLSTWGDAGEAAEAEAEAPPASQEITTWIEIELVEHDGTPVGGEPYRVIAADGRIIEGSLDGRGFARVDGVAPGTGTVLFPKRDRSDWDGAELVVPEEHAEPPARTWVEIELVEDDGSPVRNEPFVIYAGDREVARGRLDGAGRARVEGVPEGACAVVFPLRHATDVEAV